MSKILLLFLIVIAVMFWFFAIYDIAKSRFYNQNENTFWLFSVLLFPILGSILYFLIRKKVTTKEPRRFHPDFKKYPEE